MSSRCYDSVSGYGFQYAPLTAQVALDGILFIVLSITLVVWFILRITKLRRKSALKWYLFGISLIFILLATLLDLAANVLSACLVIGLQRQFELGASSSWFYWISTILVLATILIPLAGAFYKTAYARSAKVIYIVGSVIVGFISIFIIAYRGVATRTITTRRSLFRDGPDPATTYALGLTANVFTFIASLVAIAELLTFSIALQRKGRTGALIVWVAILCASLLGSAILGIVGASSFYHEIFTTDASVIAYDVFFQLFNALNFISLILVAEHSLIVAACNTTDGTRLEAADAPTGSDPGAMMPQQQMMHGQPMYVYLPQQNQGFQPQYAPGQQPIYQTHPGMLGQPQQLYQVIPAQGPHATHVPQQFQPHIGTATAPRAADSAVSPVEASASPPLSQSAVHSSSGTEQRFNQR